MNKLVLTITTTTLMALMIACSPAAKNSDAKPANNGNTATAANDKPKTESSPATNTATSSTSGDIAGTYSVSGASLDGKSYDGELLVTKRDSVFQFSWKVGTSSYDGVGVQSGNNIAVAYSSGADGKGCGAVIYKINTSDDSLDGKWGEWGVNQAGTEKAVATAKTTPTNGSFDVSGTNADGSAYKGKLTVERGSEDVYQFSWDVGQKYIGTGVKMGDYLAAGSGSKQCGFVIYEAKGSKLEGKWGVPGTTKLGTETASKK